MKCPIDNNELNMTDRQGIEIDFCPKCRGVWLDRGELDKIIERSGSDVLDSKTVNNDQPKHQELQSNRSSYDNKYDDDRKYSKKRKKENFLGDLFDF